VILTWTLSGDGGQRYLLGLCVPVLADRQRARMSRPM
jgi:hypothetical protein